MSGMANWKAKIELDIKDLQKQLIDADEKIDKFANEDRKVKLDIDTKTLESAIQKLDKMLDSLGKGTGDFKQFENLSKELSSIVSEVQSLSKAFGKVDDSGAKTLLSSIQNIDKSLSELSQNILNVNKNMSNMGGNTSGAVKQVENISNAYQNAAKEAEKLADAQSKIGQKTNISLGDSKEQSTEIDLYHNLEKRKVTYDEIIDKIQTIVSLKEKEKSLSKTSDDTKLYQNLYDENDINWAGDTEGTINRISDRLKEIYTKYNGKISLIDENDIQEATYLLDILKGSGESPNLNKSQEKFYQNKKFSNDSLFDNIRVDSQKAEEIDKINTELSETYRWFNQLEGVSLNENIANEIKSLISDMQIGGKTASEYANDLLKIFNIEVGSNSAVEQQNKLQEELKETQQQAEETKSALNDLSNIKGLKHYTDEVFDKFDNNMFGSGIGENRLGKAAYFFDEKNSSDWEAIGEYSKYLTTWSAEQVKIFDQTLGFTEEQINQIIKEFYSDVDEDIQEDYKFDLKNIMDEDLYEFKSKFGIELQDVMKSLGYDAVKTNGGEYAFYNTDKLIREVQVYDQEAQKIIDINNKVEESIKETSSDQTKDAFPSTEATVSVEKIADGFKEVKQETEKATESAKEYGKIISQVGLVGKKYNEFGEQVPSKYSYTRQTGENQVQTITVKFEKDKESGEIVEREIIGEYITGFQALEKEIDKADKKVFDLKKNLESNKIKLGDNYDTSALDKLIEDAENDANMLYEALRKVYNEQSEYEYSIAQYDDERAKKQASYNTQLENAKKIEEARAKNVSDKKDESAEKKRQDNITQTNRLLNKQQILIDKIEKTYKRTSDNPIDKAIDDTKDLEKLTEKKAAIKEKIDLVYNKGRNSTNEETFLEIEQLISEYKQLAAVKLKANNPSKQELGGQKLDVLLSQQVAQYNQLIAKAEKYGDATADIVQKLKDQRDAIAEMNSDGIYTAKSGLKADDYYSARDNYKKDKAELTSYEQVAKINNALNETNSLLNSLKVPSGFEGSFSTLESEVQRLNSEFGSGKISATEYASSIKKAFSDYKTPIDNKEKETWDDLTNSLNRYATLQKRIASNNVLSTDVEEAKNLKRHIDDLKESDILPKDKLNIVDEKLQQINQTVTDLKAKLKESTLDSLQGSIDKYKKIYDQRSTYSSDFTPSEQYTKNLTGLDTAIENLVKYRNTLKNVSEVTAEQEAELKRMVATCEKASDSFKSLSASEKGTSQIAIDKLVQRINKDLDECTNYSKEAKLGLRALRDELESANPRNLKEITSEIINIENAEIRAGRAGRSFFDTLKNSGFHQIAAQMAGMFGVYDVINVIKQAASTVTELNTQITELAKVSEQSSRQVYADFDSYADIAKEVRGTISDTIAATADWSKNGYSIPDAKQLAEISQLYKNVGDGIDIDAANESLISTLKGFQLEADQAEHIVDVFNEVSNNEAISSGGIGEALQRSAASFNAASTSLEKSVSLVTATNSVLQDPEKVGKQILAYLYSNVMKIKVAISVKILRRTRPRKDYNVCFNY